MPRKSRLKGMLQVAHFSVIGVMNALVDIGTLNLFLIVWPTTDKRMLLLYNTIAYSLAVTNSYIWNSRLTFREHAEFNTREKIYFVGQAIVSLLISNTVFIVGVSVLELWPISHWITNNIAKGLAMFLSSAASFFFMKYLVFWNLKDKNN